MSGKPAVRVAALPDLGPGENARDSASGAIWSYALPTRDLGTILALGRPTHASATALSQIARDRLVVVADEPGGPPWSMADGSVDLVATVDQAWSERVVADPDVAAEVERVLAPGGCLFVRLGPGGSTAGPAQPALPAGVTDNDVLWLGLRGGEIRAVVPASDRALVGLVTARWNDDLEVRSRLRRIVRRLRGRPSTDLATEAGALRPPAAAGPIGRPPAYVRSAATAAGLDVDGHRWALFDPGSYGTKKILLFLVAPGRDRPDLVVKLVRDTRFNARLEAAWAALRDLGSRAPELSGLGPRPLFLGHHAGLALMAESIVDGAPLKARLGDDPNDPLIGTVVDRLVSLGIATADSSTLTPAEVAAELRPMIERYAAIYRPPSAERQALVAAVDRIGRSGRPFPLVLQHGDAGTWNVLVGDDGEPTLIDWEAAVPRGMPLWDLFYFVRSAAVGVARRTGHRNALAGVEHELFEAGPLSDRLVAAVGRYGAGTGLDGDLIEPLFQLCWMHRALKASSTLPPAQLARGHYRRLLWRSVERRDAPGLSRLFRAVDAGAE